jgi:calcium-dependent protein kinase
VKLTDFGFATAYRAGEKLDLSLGSPLYMSPELVREQVYDNRVDVWSLGCIAYILLSGIPPFWGNNKQAIYDAVQNNPLKFNDNFSKISKEAKDFITKCLQKDFHRRLFIKDLLEHPWMKSVQEKQIDDAVMLDIGRNLFEFQKTTAF